MRVLTLSLFCLLAVGCLDEPELKECTEFEFGTDGCPSEPCQLYCQALVQQCPDTTSNEDTCMSDCLFEPVNESLTPGALNDDSGNTLGCRITQLREGGSDKCEQASLTQSNICVGVSCADYCEVMMEHCEGAYLTQQSCEESCELLPRAQDDSEADANTIECRFKYAREASQSGSSVTGKPLLCERASLSGGGKCGTPCDTYCHLMDQNCTEGSSKLYDTPEICQRVCRGMDSNGSFADFKTDEDTVQCRNWHAAVPASRDPETHCAHASVYNASHCGTGRADGSAPRQWPCGTYCTAVLTSCQEERPYPDLAHCLDDCVQLLVTVDVLQGVPLYPGPNKLECPVP